MNTDRKTELQEVSLWPRISILLVVRNEKPYIEKCIRSILSSDCQEEIELLVVDGGSDDGTREIAMSLAHENSRIRVLNNPGRILPAGNNVGLRYARGEIIIRMDGHSEYPRDYVRKNLETLERTGAEVIGGMWNMCPGANTPTGHAVAAAQSCRFGVGNASFRFGHREQEVDTVPYGCFRREVFESFGLYDERMERNEDAELFSRIRNGGGKVVMCPDIHLNYRCRPTFRAMCQQAYANGLWNVYSWYLVRRGVSLRHFVPFLFTTSFISLGLLGLWYGLFWLMLAGEVALYLGLAATFTTKTFRKYNASWWLTLMAFHLLHIAYGLGSTWGWLNVLPRYGLRRRQIPDMLPPRGKQSV